MNLIQWVGWEIWWIGKGTGKYFANIDCVRAQENNPVGVFICIKVCICLTPTFYSIPLPPSLSQLLPLTTTDCSLVSLILKHLLSVFKVGRVSDPFNLGSLCWFSDVILEHFSDVTLGIVASCRLTQGCSPMMRGSGSFWMRGGETLRWTSMAASTSHVGCIDLPPQRTSSLPMRRAVPLT